MMLEIYVKRIQNGEQMVRHLLNLYAIESREILFKENCLFYL